MNNTLSFFIILRLDERVDQKLEKIFKLSSFPETNLKTEEIAVVTSFFIKLLIY